MDKVDFKFDGEMQPDVALEELYKELYPFSEIVGNANVLIMPFLLIVLHLDIQLQKYHK